MDRDSLGGTLVGETVDTIDDGAGWCHLRRGIARLVGQIVHGMLMMMEISELKC